MRTILIFAFLLGSIPAISQNLYLLASKEIQSGPIPDYYIQAIDPNTCQQSLLVDIDESGHSFSFALFINGLAIGPDGSFYVYGIDPFSPKLAFFAKIDLTTGELLFLVEGLDVNVNSMVCSADNKIYAGSNDLYILDLNTLSGVLYPDIFQSGVADLLGDLTFRNGQLLCAAYDYSTSNNAIMSIDLEALPILKYVMPMETGSNDIVPFGIGTMSVSCDSSRTFASAQNPIGPNIADYLYEVDFTTQTLTNICGVVPYVLDLASPTEHLASNCNISIDLDVDNSSGVVGNGFSGPALCLAPSGPAPVADLDFLLESGSRIDSMTVHLLSPDPDGAFLEAQPVAGLLLEGAPSTRLKWTNATAVKDTVFRNALGTVRYHNPANPPTEGLRTIMVVGYANNGSRDTAYTTFAVGITPYAGLDTTLLFCGTNTAVQLQDYLSPNAATTGQWQPASTYLPGNDPNGTYQYLVSSTYCGMDTAQITVSAQSSITATLLVSACSGTFYTYQNTPIAAGSSQNFTFPNPVTGCDSVVMVLVTALPIASSTLAVSACPGAFYTYQNMPIAAGSSQVFTLQNPITGCDSVVTVQVTALPIASSTLTASACSGAFYTYQNTSIAAGSSQSFTLQNPITGCDSVVTVQVTALPFASSTLLVSACPGAFYTYQNTPIAVGSSQMFTLQNPITGCDSVVSVQVMALPVASSTLTASACSGAFYTYQNMPIAAGSSQSFTLQNPITGCDSVVTVQVTALPIASSTLTVSACPGAFYTYQNTPIAAGSSQSFTLQNPITGCDSVVTVQVSIALEYALTDTVFVCPGNTYTVAGTQILPGETKVFLEQTVQGCDSTVQITVRAFPALDFETVVEKSCTNDPTGSINITLPTAAPPPYEISLDEGANWSNNLEASQLSAGAISFLVRDGNGCETPGAAQIEGHEPLLVTLDNAVLPCDGPQGVVLQPTVSGSVIGLDYQWTNGAATPSINITSPGLFTVKVSNVCETVQRSATVQWEGLEAATEAFIPNIVALGQGENGVFGAFFNAAIEVNAYQLNVYDRWGSLVFSSSEASKSWDGTVRGKTAEPGVYIWFLQAKTNYCGQAFTIEKKGDVTVIR